MIESILDSVKKVLGIDEEYTAFDTDITMHINSAFATLNQIGIGPADGFSILDKTAVWHEYLAGDDKLSSVKTYVFLSVRVIFDPPATSFHLASLKEQIKELEWRLNTVREGEAWTMPQTQLPS